MSVSEIIWDILVHIFVISWVAIVVEGVVMCMEKIEYEKIQRLMTYTGMVMAICLGSVLMMWAMR